MSDEDGRAGVWSGAARGSAAVLVVSGDAALVEEVERCAAGAGVRPERTDGVPAALLRWGRAGLVVVGHDLVDELARASPPRRDHVHLAGREVADVAALRAAVAVGVRSTVELPAGNDWLTTLMSAVADPRPPGQVVALTGASGGVGVSTLAVALAQRVGAHRTALLVDTDPTAAGAGLVLGLDAAAGRDATGLTWEDLTRAGGRVAPTSLRAGVPQRDGVGVLGWGGGSVDRSPPELGVPPAPVLRGVLEAARQAYDLVVVDLARGSGEVHDVVVSRADRVWVLVRPTVVGLAAGAARVAAAGPGVSVVVRGPGLDDATVARTVDAPVVARLGEQRGLDEAVDLGLGPLGRLGRRGSRKLRGPLGRTVEALVGDLRAIGTEASWMA